MCGLGFAEPHLWWVGVGSRVPSYIRIVRGGGEVAGARAAVTASQRYIPTTTSCHSQNRIVWL